MRTTKTVKVFEVMYDGKGEGPMGDGTFIARFRSKTEAERFAKNRTAYGKPCTVSETDAPRHIAQRWGCA